jgi:aryl-alcohol dehydrogenase-like predicted oxidoreductase
MFCPAHIADIYGADGYSERLIGKTIKDRRKDVFLATKFAFDIKKGGVNGTPEYVHSACAASLERLGTDYIDLYYMHRIDPKV